MRVSKNWVKFNKMFTLSPCPFLYHYQPNVMPPEKHRAYAVQWLGLALVMLVGGLVLTRRLSP